MSAPSATAASAAAPVSVQPGLAILVLALLLSIQPVTTDLYLPALPALTRSLGAPMAAAQLTLSGLLLAFGCSQMVWGPLSDRFGRRPILLAGLTIYTVASLGSAFAPTMGLLILWRIAQGAAMGAVVMCARAIVRDLYTPLEGARAMSKALTGLGIVACICAPMGGLLSEWLGWRAALLALTVYAVVTLALVAWMGWHQPWALTLPFYLFMVGHGIHQPCGQSGAVGPFPKAAGVASALNGFMMMLAAFAIGGWLGMRLDGTVWPLVNGIWFWSVALAVISWTLVQKFGAPREHA